jgi:phospholipid/cholesterol/gamma-HCH transport system permease protein
MKNNVVYKKLTLPGRLFYLLGVFFLSSTPGQQFTLFVKTVASVFSRKKNFKSDSKNVINQIFFTGVEIFTSPFYSSHSFWHRDYH